MKTINLVLTKFVAAIVFYAVAVSVHAADWSYTVRPSDTLWGICQTYTDYPACWRDIQTHNKIADPTKLSIGDKVLVPVQWLKKAPAAATVSYASGEAYLVLGAESRLLKFGDQLVVGAEVMTLQGSATLQFADGSTLVLGKESRLVLDAVSAFSQTLGGVIEVSLPQGEVTIRVPVTKPRTKFNVRTPSSVAAVRGTYFRVASDAETTGSKSEVLEGLVGFGSEQDTIALEQGFASKIEKKGASVLPPVKLLSAPNWNRSCNDPGYAAWSEPVGAKRYKLALMENDANLDKVISEVLVASNDHTFVDLDNGCYQLRVSAIDQYGFNGKERQREFCYNLQQLDTPVVDAGSLRKSTLFVDWKDVRYASSYMVEVSSDGSFSNLLASQTVSTSELTVLLEESVNPVYVRVRAAAGSRVRSDQSEIAQYHRERNYGWLAGIVAVVLAFAVL